METDALKAEASKKDTKAPLTYWKYGSNDLCTIFKVFWSNTVHLC